MGCSNSKSQHAHVRGVPDPPGQPRPPIAPGEQNGDQGYDRGKGGVDSSTKRPPNSAQGPTTTGAPYDRADSDMGREPGSVVYEEGGLGGGPGGWPGPEEHWGHTKTRLGEDILLDASQDRAVVPAVAGPSDSLSLMPDTGTGPEGQYAVGELIGKGSFGKVYAGLRLDDGAEAALKVMDRSRVKGSSIYREWNVLRHLGSHPAIVEYKGAFKTQGEVTFVFENMRGGELFDRLVKRGAYSETEARAPFRALAEGLAYLHSRGIVHRDLKPENLLMKYDSDSIAPRVHAPPESSASLGMTVGESGSPSNVAVVHAPSAGETQSIPGRNSSTSRHALSDGGTQGRARVVNAATASLGKKIQGQTAGGRGIKTMISGLVPRTVGKPGARASSRGAAGMFPSASCSVDPGALLPISTTARWESRGAAQREVTAYNMWLEPVLKISDFGLSQLIGPREKLLKICGTWAYAAPEMSDPTRPGYDTKFDIFSFGVVLYVTLCGYHPFDPTGSLPVPEIKARARSATFDFEGEEWASVSPMAKDLLKRTIARDPEARLDSVRMLTHPWFRLPGELPLPPRMPALLVGDGGEGYRADSHAESHGQNVAPADVDPSMRVVAMTRQQPKPSRVAPPATDALHPGTLFTTPLAHALRPAESSPVVSAASGSRRSSTTARIAGVHAVGPTAGTNRRRSAAAVLPVGSSPATLSQGHGAGEYDAHMAGEDVQ